MFTKVRNRHGLGQAGFTLVELIMFIVIVGVGVAGIVSVMNVVTRNSADPMIRKQALAIAESLLEEVQLMPFTFCDPDDANAENAMAADAANCPAAGGIGGVENLGPDTDTNGTETRYGGAQPQFDNVNDYDGFTMNEDNGGILDIIETEIPALSAYSATVTMTQPGLNGIAADRTLLISVTVTGPGDVQITLEGYRVRYAPQAVQ